MHRELDQLRCSLLRVGLLAAGLGCTPEERTRLTLCARENAAGLLAPTIQELDRQLLKLTREVALQAQCAVSKAAAAPDDPRRKVCP